MSTSFELSAMKSSFSLSSLRSGPAPPGGAGDQLERPYHSLTKKRKEPCREAWRRSWGSAASGGSAGDDLWPLLQHHYDYIMDNQIIDSCKEANGELTMHNSSALHHGPRLLNPTSSFNRQWSLSQLISEFSELCQWLTHVQEEIYSSPENLASRKLRMSRMSELATVEPRRVKFIEQAAAILERIPEASAEVSWRMEHLNVKWESLRLLLSPDQQHKDGDCSDTVEPAHELRCLRRWLHVMEGRLPPPSLAAARAAPYHELRRKLREHQLPMNDFSGAPYPWNEQGYIPWTSPACCGLYMTKQLYFVSEKTLSKTVEERKQTALTKEVVQEQSIWVTGFDQELMEIPTNVDGIQDIGFTKQACIPWMGQHYFYRMSSETQCTSKTLLNWFPLCDNGKLIGVGFVAVGALNKKTGETFYFEKSSKLILGTIVPRGPKCLYKLAEDTALTSMHIYFVDKPWKIDCPLFG